jgi:hypothetical protein
MEYALSQNEKLNGQKISAAIFYFDFLLLID